MRKVFRAINQEKRRSWLFGGASNSTQINGGGVAEIYGSSSSLDNCSGDQKRNTNTSGFFRKRKAEKTDVLSADFQLVEQRVERMLQAVSHSRLKLIECLRSHSKRENVEERKKKLEEYVFAQALLKDSDDLKSVATNGLLSEVMATYGLSLNHTLDELVQTELELEVQIVEPLGRYAEEEKTLCQQKEKLRKAVLDLDSAKRRFHSQQTQGGDGDRLDQLQDEVDQCYVRVDSLKDNYVADVYTLAGKEVLIASLYRVLVEHQLDYHRTAVTQLENALPEISRKLAGYARRPMYGCALEDHLRYSGREIALVLEVCCAALCEISLKHEGLFRISGNASKVRRLKAGFDAGELDLIDYDKDPHSIASALKSYLRELPDPLMTYNLFSSWKAAGSFRLDGSERLSAIQQLLERLPRANVVNLRYLMKFLQLLAREEEETRMSISNIAIVFGPNLIWGPSAGAHGSAGSDNMLGAKLVETLVMNADYFFPGEVRFSSSLISPLHDKLGGFLDSQGGSPAVVLQKIHSSSPPHLSNRSAENEVDVPTRRTPVDTTNPIETSSSRRQEQPVAVTQLSVRKPKAPAPPPPPPSHQAETSPIGSVRLHNESFRAAVSEEEFFESPVAGGVGLSKSSSEDGSLNAYSDEAGDYAEVAREGEQVAYSAIQKNRQPSSPSGEASSSPCSPASASDVLILTNEAPAYATVADEEGENFMADFKQCHKKTLSVDSSLANRKVESAGQEEGVGARGRAGLPPFPNPLPQPTRPPPPSVASLERNSVLRSSGGRASEAEEAPAPVAKPRRYLRSSGPQRPPQPSTYEFESAEPTSAAGGGTTVLIVSPTEQRTDNKSPPFNKPPIPQKPSRLANELDPAVTHL